MGVFEAVGVNKLVHLTDLRPYIFVSQWLHTACLHDYRKEGAERCLIQQSNTLLNKHFHQPFSWNCKIFLFSSQNFETLGYRTNYGVRAKDDYPQPLQRPVQYGL